MSLATMAFAADEHKITSAAFPVYLDDEDLEMNYTLYFLDGVSDLPYMDVNDWLAVLPELFSYTKFTMEVEEPVVTYTWHNSKPEAMDNGMTMKIDFDRNTIEFMDYNLFTLRPDASTILDSITLDVFNDAGEPVLLEKVNTGSFTRYGHVLAFPLSYYGIDLVQQDGLYLIPLQTLSDIIMPNAKKGNFYFNGQCVILSADVTLCSDLYYSAPTGERGRALTEFGYGELCMMLDYFYGLKENHKIESFDRFFRDVGFEALLKGAEVKQADGAIYRMISDFIDDGHARWHAFSYLTVPVDYSVTGTSKTRILKHLDRQKTARARYYPDGIPGYQEIGNTAYITFDMFNNLLPDPNEYYLVENLDDIPEGDVFVLIMKAHPMITRENSPIENVVLDLSANIGGKDNVAVYVIAWFLGECQTSTIDNMTGAMCTTAYRADVNRDRVFDEKDTLGDRNLFCLTSGTSFSNGNFEPCVFKESGMVTLLGRTSAGESCNVLIVNSAWGTSFQISANLQASSPQEWFILRY